MSYVVTDIETVADSSIWQVEQEIPKISEEKKPTPADMAHLETVASRFASGARLHPSDVEKAASIAERAGQAAFAQELVARLPPSDPVPPIYACRPIVIGCARLDEDLRCTRIGAIEEQGETPEVSEPRMLRAWSEYMANGKKIVTWFGRGFDLPVLTSRAFVRGVPLPWYFEEPYRYRYSEDKHVDLCDVLSNYGAVRGGIKLDAYSRALGLPGKPPGIDGSMVGRMYAEDRYREIVDYCLTDVIATTICFLRWKLLKGTPREKYIEGIHSVEACLCEMGTLSEILTAWTSKIDWNRLTELP